jgi:hypothetical protein
MLVKRQDDGVDENHHVNELREERGLDEVNNQSLETL